MYRHPMCRLPMFNLQTVPNKLRLKLALLFEIQPIPLVVIPLPIPWELTPKKLSCARKKPETRSTIISEGHWAQITKRPYSKKDLPPSHIVRSTIISSEYSAQRSGKNFK